MKTRLALLLLVLVLTATAPAGASQGYGPKIELSALVGARLGGHFSNGNFSVSDSLSLNDLQLQNSVSWSGIFGWNFTENGQLELTWTHQPTEMEVQGDLSTPDSTLFDVSVDSFLASGLYRFGRFYDRMRPWLGVGFGATRFKAEGADSDVKFAFGATAGAHYGIDSRWAFRFQGRFITTYIGQSDVLFCSAGCWNGTSNSYIRQWDLAAGITLKL